MCSQEKPLSGSLTRPYRKPTLVRIPSCSQALLQIISAMASLTQPMKKLFRLQKLLMLTTLFLPQKMVTTAILATVDVNYLVVKDKD